MNDIYANCDKPYIIGVDEVGIGCIAGPTYVTAFKAPKDWFLLGLRDSKKLTEKKRETYSNKLRNQRLDGTVKFSIQSGDVSSIDKMGILNVVHELYLKAINEIGYEDSLIMIDGRKFKETRYEYVALVKGDDLIPHISAASVLAKVARDSYMKTMDPQFPSYNWKKNKGYGTAEHLEALKKHGVTPLHRRSYEPVKSMVSQ